MNTKMYTVVWTQKGREFYGVPKGEHGVVPLENEQAEVKFNVNKKRIGRPKMRWATVYPFFDTKDEAEAYRGGNTDWEVVAVQIIPSLTN